MVESVYSPIPIGEISEARELPSHTYKLDLERGRIVGRIDGLEAVNQAITKILKTPRFKCFIYDGQYGSELEETITTGDATIDYINTAAEGFVKDALAPDTRILNVYDFKTELENDAAHISFKADTIYGETTIEVVL